MLDDHALPEGMNPKQKTMAAKMLPTVQGHLKMAQEATAKKGKS